jgi:predicted DNA-binding helix-hairpin-helix protein
MEPNYQKFNEMSYKELCQLPGVGKTTAKRIIAQRPFRRDTDLFKVNGLGKGTLKKLGITKAVKQRKKWLYHPYQGDGVEYPHDCFAYDTRSGQLDFFWRIPRKYRNYYTVD